MLKQLTKLGLLLAETLETPIPGAVRVKVLYFQLGLNAIVLISVMQLSMSLILVKH